MESKTNEMKKVSSKSECEYCGKLGAVSNKTQHQKTMACQKAQQTGIKYQPNKPNEVLQAYRDVNKTRRERDIEKLGIDAVREREKVAKQNLRAKQKATEEKDEVVLPKAIAKIPKATKDIKKLIDSVDNQKKMIIEAVNSNNKQIIPSLCKQMMEKSSIKIKESISNINNIKTKEDFLQQFIQASEIKNNDTAKQYVNDFYKFSVRYTDERPNFSDLTWLNDYNNVYKFIQKSKKKNGEPYADTSKRTLFTALGSITSVLGIDFFEVSKKYNHLAKTASKALQKKQQDNVMNENQKSKSITWNQLLDLEHVFDDDNGGTPFTRAMFSIYTQLAPRRGKDYRLMKVMIKKNKKDTINILNLDTNYNWLLLSENMLPTRIVFNIYKTAKKKGYGQYIIEKIPSKLASNLQEYVVDSELENNNFLFHQGKNKNKPYDQPNFSTLISKKIFELYSGQKIDINSMRHAYVSYMLKNNISQAKKLAIAKTMGTSLSELLNVYNKIDLDDEIDDD